MDLRSLCYLLFVFVLGIKLLEGIKLRKKIPQKKLSETVSTLSNISITSLSTSSTTLTENSKDKSLFKKRPKSTTESRTTEYKTNESTTKGSRTTEYPTEETTTKYTTEETTAEYTTEETTTEETTTEPTTTKLTTSETTTEQTTLNPKIHEISLKSTKSLVSPTKVTNSSETKSWQKYVSQSTPAFKSSSKRPHGKSNDSSQNSTPETSKSTEENQPAKVVIHKHITPSIGSSKNSKANTKPDKNNSHESSTDVESLSTTSYNQSSAVDVKIDINVDIKLGSSSTTSSTVSARYLGFEGNSTATPFPKVHEARYEKKKVVAGIFLVVLLSISAACAILFVLMPTKYEVRKSHRREDQVELISSRRRCRPRFYDASLYMGL